MFKNCTLLLSALLLSCSLSAQVNLLNAQKVTEIGKVSDAQKLADNDGPIAYGYVDDRDVLWSKVVWEVIDLNQKINLPYYFPIDTTSVTSNRKSLWNTLLKGINEKKMDAYADSFFTTKYTKAELDSTHLIYEYINQGVTYPVAISSADIEAYMVKGMWYFDKRQGELKYRLIALAPMRKDLASNMGRPTDPTTGQYLTPEDDKLYEIFWVFYPEAREVLHDAKVFNPQNASQPISFDHLLNSRRFSASIVRTENLYGNRAIDEYVKGNSLFQLLEARKIKEDIRNKEMDMWNY